jgi:hypothetical protein
MEMHYEIVTIGVRPGKPAEALQRIGPAAPLREGARLLGFWTTEHGLLNQLISLWARAGASPSDAPGDTLQGAEWLRAIADLVTDVGCESFAQFPYLPEVRPGRFGPYYELRSYRLRPAMVQPTVDLWKEYIDARAKLSPLTAALYALGGPLQRYVHIWPYTSLDERLRLRALAVEKRLWPPPGGVDLLTAQESWIMLPAAFSPLQ